MNQSQFLGLVRHVLAAAGVILAANGGSSPELLEQGSGIVLTLAALGWSFWEKRAK